MRHKILSLFVNTLTINEKHYLLTRDKLTQTIQMQLSQKKKTFSEFFFQFLKSILNFQHLLKKDDPRSRCISRNTGSEKYGRINVQKPVFHISLRETTTQMGRKTVAISMVEFLKYLLITVKVVALEKISFSDTQNPKAVSYHIDNRWEALSRYLREFNTNY